MRLYAPVSKDKDKGSDIASHNLYKGYLAQHTSIRLLVVVATGLVRSSITCSYLLAPKPHKTTLCLCPHKEKTQNWIIDIPPQNVALSAVWKSKRHPTVFSTSNVELLEKGYLSNCSAVVWWTPFL